jgi:hypothetical protein
MTLRPICPVLTKILEIRAGMPEPPVLRPGASLADRIWGVLNACKWLVQCPPALEVVALWAHGGNLRGFLDVVTEDLWVLPKQLQRDYSVSAQKLEGLADRLCHHVQLYEMTRALHCHRVYLEPPDYGQDHWQGFRLWRDQQLEVAEIGGGTLGRIEMVKLTSTFPVDAVSVANQIIDELAPIADDIAKAAAKPENSPAARIKDRFAFNPGQALFDGKDLGLSTGFTVEILQKLVQSIGQTVAYATLDANSKNEASDQLRKAKRAIVVSFKEHGVPCDIVTKAREGYCLCERTGKKEKVRETAKTTRRATRKTRHK